MGCSSGPDIVEDGLVLCLDAGSKRSYPGTGTTWTDLKGSNNGTLTNGPTFTTANRGGITLDGTDDKISISNTDIFSLVANQGFSICIIAKDIFVGGSWLFSIMSASGDQMVASSNEFYWASEGRAGSYAEAEYNTTFSAGTWYHIVFTRDTSGNPKIYINGVFKGTTEPNNNNINSSIDFSSASEFQLGYRATFPDPSSFYYSSTTFSHFSYYNRELTAKEIRQNYNATKGRYS